MEFFFLVGLEFYVLLGFVLLVYIYCLMANMEESEGSSSCSQRAKLSDCDHRILQTEKIDRISSLPDNVISHILSFLPMKEAVATSVLSRSWKHHWKLFPILEFDGSDKELKSFLERISPLGKPFALLNLSLYFCSGVGECFREVIGRCVRVLDLTVYYAGDGKPIKLPHSLFTSKTLVVLRLTAYIAFEVPYFVNLPCLKVLHLDSVKTSGESLTAFLPGCPVLEIMSFMNSCDKDLKTLSIRSPTLKILRLEYQISRDDKDHRLEIKAPALKHLFFSIHRLGKVAIGDLPDLVEASVVFFPSDSAELLSALEKVRFLTLNNQKNVYPFQQNFEFVPKFKNLMRLTLVTLIGPPDMLPSFLENSPNLQVLIINKVGLCSSWSAPGSPPHCLLYHLKAFELQEFIGTRKFMMEIVSYFLKNARVLEKATIDGGGAKKSKFSELELWKEILAFPWGSTTCQVMFK